MKLFFAAILVFLSFGHSMAQKKEIKIQIVHENKVVIDTTFYENSAEAKYIVENFVQQFSNAPVLIQSKMTSGLYVFDINGENWKAQEMDAYNSSAKQIVVPNEPKQINQPASKPAESIKTEPQVYETNEQMESDSLFNEFSKELDENWNEAHIKIEVDSLGSPLKYLWNEMKKSELVTDPDVQEIKSDIQGLIKGFKNTKVQLIHETDTIKGN